MLRVSGRAGIYIRFSNEYYGRVHFEVGVEFKIGLC